MLAANRQEKIMLGVRKSNLGEEIVRLKKNIDVQLGIDTNGKSADEFLKAYKQTEDTFKDLLNSCKQ